MARKRHCRYGVNKRTHHCLKQPRHGGLGRSRRRRRRR